MKNLIFALIFGLFFISCSDEAPQESATQEEFKPFAIGEKVQLKGVLGNELTLVRSERGFKLENSDKIVMIDIFGTFCAPCQEEAAFLMDFQNKNREKFQLIGLIHFEEIGDERIISDFVKKFNAYYFIANNDKNPNERLVEQILLDLNYQNALSLPFKVVYKNGEMQTLTDINNGFSNGSKFYLGGVKTEILINDFNKFAN